MEIPSFIGECPYGWIYKVERYCLINHILVFEKLSVASFGLEGRTLDWLYGWGSRTTKISWDTFREAFLQHFQLRKEKRDVMWETKSDKNLLASQSSSIHEENIGNLEVSQESMVLA